MLFLFQLLQDADLAVGLDEGGAAFRDFAGHDAALLFDPAQFDAESDLASLVVQQPFHPDLTDAGGRSVFVLQRVEPALRRFLAAGQNRIRLQRFPQLFASLVTDLLANPQQGLQSEFKSRHLFVVTP